jgi:Fic family protein
MANLISGDYLTAFKSSLNTDIDAQFFALQQRTLEPHSFTFYTSVSVMASSKIEGEKMEIDSYVKHKMLQVEYLPELTEKPNDLYNAYVFAKDNKLTKSNFGKAHKLIAAHLLPPNQRGELRNTEMLVMEHKTGKIQYEAALLTAVKAEYEKLWQDIEQLLGQSMNTVEVFYYAAFIHLAFVNIHPFADGNGRIARLLEKWFLASRLGERAWYIESEKYYYEHVNEYYRNLARLGFSYQEIDYGKSLPFLLMLPKALSVNS